MNTSDPNNPIVIREGLPQASDLLHRDGLAFISDPRDNVGGLRILDVGDAADPANPVELDHYAAHTCTAVAFQAGLAYVLGNDLPETNEEGLLVFDVSNPTSIELVALLEIHGATYDILVDGRYAYITGGPDGQHANVGLMIVELDGLAAWGDLNCDGAIDFDDIDPFVLALSGEEGYQAQFPDCNYYHGDCNGDREINFDDIDAFVGLLATP